VPVESRRLDDGWELAASAPGACVDAAATAGLSWTAAKVGRGGGLTAAGVSGEPHRDYDAEDWWFRIRADEPAPGGAEELRLALGGVATISEVFVDGVPVLESESMFAAHSVGLGAGVGELAICCRALAPRLAVRRRPRARWRTKLVAEPNLRFFRTMLLGRAPGFAPGPAVVGPWRPVSLERRSGLTCEEVTLRPRVAGRDGVLAVTGRVRAIAGASLPTSITVQVGSDSSDLDVGAGGAFAGEHRVPDVRRWWPHTHGEPHLYSVGLSDVAELLYEDRVGFRELDAASDLEADGPALRINGVPVFARGAVWTPWSLTDPDPGRETLAPLLGRVVDAGLNMLRIPGTACYESPAFHDLCDELGILVWQDLMFANLDYPESDPQFMTAVESEVRAELATLAARPSLAVLCGGSEVAQQVAMVGLDPALADGPLYGELLPRLIDEAAVAAPYIPSAPWGGSLPFRTDRGVANYFGVSAYLRPLSDARRAEIRFATECLAFANVADGEPPGAIQGAEWKAGVPRDVGAGWDFDDVRDHYLRVLFGEDPVALRYADPARYLALSREVSGVLMAETFGEWRRAGSPCRGALVLWCKDLLPGAGWGVIDASGEPKVALWHLRRALAPVAVWSTDEGLGGIALHVANDRPESLTAQLRIALYRDGAVRVEQASRELEIAAHGAVTIDAEQLIGRFVDVSWAYRFGPPAADVVAIALESADGALLSQAFRFPVGYPLRRSTSAELGLTATVTVDGADRARLRIGADRRLAYGVRTETPGWVTDDDAFSVEPGRAREIGMRRAAGSQSGEPRGRVTALNCSSAVAILVAPDAG
jgi:beta-mannosidase